MSLRTFFRTGAWYQDTQKALESDLEATAIVSNSDPYDPVITGGEGGSSTLAELLADDNDADGLTIENLANPTTDQQVATKKYVDDNAGGGSTIYTGNGSLSGNRILELDGKILTIQDGQTRMIFTPTVGVEGFQVTVFDDTGDGNLASLLLNASPLESTFLLNADFNDGVKACSIYGYANTDEGEIDYTADKHNFNSILNLAVFTNSSPADGDIWLDSNTNTGLKIRINGVTKTITVT